MQRRFDVIMTLLLGCKPFRAAGLQHNPVWLHDVILIVLMLYWQIQYIRVENGPRLLSIEHQLEWDTKHDNDLALANGYTI